METPVLLAGAAAVLLLVVAGVVAMALRGRARSRRDLVEARSEIAELRARLDALTEQLERQSAAMIRVDDPAYVITDAGAPRLEPSIPDRVVLTATVGEPLLKVVAFGHGLRRALSAESRNRIGFEVRREVRRARKQRRRETKDAWRRTQAEGRAA
ncbi:MAG: hypothetical protein JWR90_249 [Marmoricola sp.]|jgi:hypothetical protein|nr:hypothetical protein [Marmoricola sp.]